MRRILGLLLFVGLAGTLAGCLTLMPVGSHFDRGADFTLYHTYAWGPADTLPVTDERLRDNPYFVDDVHGAISRSLEDRGLRRVDSEPADLFVHVHAAITGRVEVATRPGQYRDCVASDCRPTVNQYNAGTLVIDIMEAKTHQLVWRGWAEHRLEDMLDEPAQVKRRVDDAVRRIFETFPLTLEKTSRRTALEGTR